MTKRNRKIVGRSFNITSGAFGCTLQSNMMSRLWVCTDVANLEIAMFAEVTNKSASLAKNLLENYKWKSPIGDKATNWCFLIGDWCFSKSPIGHFITMWWYWKTSILNSKSPIGHFITNWWFPLLVLYCVWVWWTSLGSHFNDLKQRDQKKWSSLV